MAQNSNEIKYLCIRNGIAFDGTGSWSFSNDFARNVVISSLSSHTNNCKNNFLVLGQRPTDDINGSFRASEKLLVLDLVKKNKVLLDFALYNGE